MSAIHSSMLWLLAVSCLSGGCASSPSEPSPPATKPVVAAPTTSRSADQPPCWGKRIWAHPIDDGRTIVVDERLLGGDPASGLGSPCYWRLLRAGETEGMVLWVHITDFSCGVGPCIYPITVLYADLIGGELVTVFNQAGTCYATRVHRDASGGMEARPMPTPGLDHKHGTDVGPAMASASVDVGSGGELLLKVADDAGHEYRFRLRSRQNPANGLYVEYWEPIADAASRPTTRGVVN